ncbi:MAG: glycosyltransferase [Planctomycetes bacterium]|nr:glycosyltransferase [Planctomycetota bacterium]
MRAWKRGGRGAVLYFYLWQLALARRARALDRALDFDVVHHVTFASSWIPSGLAFVGKPFVWGPVGRHPRVPDRFLARGDLRARAAELAKAACKRAVELADPFLAATRRRADLVLGIGPDDVAVLPAPVRLRARAFLACGTEHVPPARDRFERSAGFDVVFAGRLVDLKGPRLALEAFARLARAAPEARLAFVGAGPLRATLLARAAELGLADRVLVTGHVPRAEVLARLARSDAFLFPSFEGAGMVVVEAMAAGNPVVCLDWGGPAAMTGAREPAPRGLVAPVESTFEATAAGLGDALCALHADEALRRRLARNACAWTLANATWSAKGERIDELYAFAEARHGRAAPTPPRDTVRAREAA